MRNSQIIILASCILLGLINASDVSQETPGACGPIEKTDGRCVKIGLKSYIHQDGIKENWYSAVHSCRRLNGNLLTIDNADEMSAISTYLKGRYYDPYNNVPNNTYDVWKRLLEMAVWTAGNDLAEDEQFYSISTGKKLPYVQLPERRATTAHCLTLGLDYPTETVVMEDENCKDTKKHYMCETEVN